MVKKRIDTNIRCPSCGGQLYPKVIACDTCGLKVEGDFVTNEFGALTPAELHFLRVFIYCEGRIRDMEAALGVSYPTVKGHLASIKEKLNLARDAAVVGEPATPSAPAAPSEPEVPQPPQDAKAPVVEPHDVLDQLESGRLDPKEAVRLLKSRKKGGTP
jgi:hypothetical protein